MALSGRKSVQPQNPFKRFKMCTTTVTTYACHHKDTDTWPCNACLDNPDQECSSAQTLPPQNEDRPCPKCAAAANDDEAELLAALEKIKTDPELAAHSPSSKPVGRAKTRQYFERCGHYAQQRLEGYNREAGDPEWFDLPMEGSCYGCCSSAGWKLQEKKLTGDWKDPWGELGKCKDVVKNTSVEIDKDGRVKGEDEPVGESSPVPGPSRGPKRVDDAEYDGDSEGEDSYLSDRVIDESRDKNKARSGMRHPPAEENDDDLYRSDEGDDDGEYYDDEYPDEDDFDGDITGRDDVRHHHDASRQEPLGKQREEIHPLDRPLMLTAGERLEMKIPLNAEITERKLMELREKEKEQQRRREESQRMRAYGTM